MAKYHLSDILSVTTGKLLSSRHVSGIYDILNYMTGENLFTHQLPRALKSCTPHILKQYPQLAKIEFDIELQNENTILIWLQKQIKKYGDYLEITPLTAGEYEAQDPIYELVGMLKETGKSTYDFTIKPADFCSTLQASAYTAGVIKLTA